MRSELQLVRVTRALLHVLFIHGPHVHNDFFSPRPALATCFSWFSPLPCRMASRHSRLLSRCRMRRGRCLDSVLLVACGRWLRCGVRVAVLPARTCATQRCSVFMRSRSVSVPPVASTAHACLLVCPRHCPLVASTALPSSAATHRVGHEPPQLFDVGTAKLVRAHFLGTVARFPGLRPTHRPRRHAHRLPGGGRRQGAQAGRPAGQH